MDKEFHIRKLVELLNEDWGRSSIVAHNRITDIRTLLTTLGAGFAGLESTAVEAETIIGTALGMGDERLTDEDIDALLPILQDLRHQLSQVTDLATSPWSA